MAKRCWVKLFGSFPMYFMTDHAQLVRFCMLALDRIDPKHFRWFQEITINGSELTSLAGRTMVLGDSFSRNPEHRDALLSALEARTGDLRQMHAVLKGFDIEELRTTEPWDGGFRPPPHKEVTKDWPGVQLRRSANHQTARKTT